MLIRASAGRLQCLRCDLGPCFLKSTWTTRCKLSRRLPCLRARVGSGCDRLVVTFDKEGTVLADGQAEAFMQEHEDDAKELGATAFSQLKAAQAVLVPGKRCVILVCFFFPSCGAQNRL